MNPNPVIKHLDVFENTSARLITGIVSVMEYEFGLQRPEETFSYRVVIAVTGRTHTLAISLFVQKFFEKTATVLAAPI